MRALKIAGAALLIVSALIGTRSLRLSAFTQHRAGQRYADIYYLPRAEWLPVLTLGYHAAAADLIWSRSLVYFGEELGHSGAVKHAFAYTDAVLALDPDFRSAYRWIATAALYRPQAVSIDAGLRAATYLERALDRWPRDGELHWDYGSLLRFELAPLETDRARKEQLLERSAPHLQAAARLGAGPPWLALNSVDLLNKLGRTEKAIRHLEELHGTVSDEQVKAEIEERLATLRSHAHVEAMRTADAQFNQSHASSYPYLSPELFFFVGSRNDADAYQQLIENWFVSEPEAISASEGSPATATVE